MSRARLKFVRSKSDYQHLVEVDCATFTSADAFSSVDEWKDTRNYLLLLDEQVIGTTALNVDKYWDNELYKYIEQPGCLYVASTAVLPIHQGRGWGRFLKEWQVKYARTHKCSVIKTSCRESNVRMIKLNESFGFKVVRCSSPGYENPEERSTDMELQL